MSEIYFIENEIRDNCKVLREICDIKKGKQLSRIDMLQNGEYYVLNGGIEPSGYTNEYNSEANVISISEGGNSCGYVNFNKSRFWSGGHNYVLDNVHIDSSYLYHYLKYKQQEIMDLRVGSGLPNIPKRILSNFLVIYPIIEEQQKIAALLNDIDSKIDNQQQKIEKLKNLRQAMLVKMFPQEGQVVPDIRFKDDNRKNFDVWKKDKMINIAPLQRGFDLPVAKRLNGAYPVVCSNGISSYHQEFKCEGYAVVTGRSGSIGTVTYLEYCKYWPHNTALWVTNFNDNHPKFIYYLYLTLHLERLSTGTGVPTLNRNDVHNLEVFIPVFEEQKKIAEYFTSLDNLIDMEKIKYNKLLNLKEALLYKLLPVRS